MMAKVLLVGGAGYVGSAVAALAVDRGHDVWILDDFSTGRIELVRGLGLESKLAVSKCGDQEKVGAFLRACLRNGRPTFDCVMHFAARNIVSESVRKPEAYFENNVEETERLLSTLLSHGIRRFVFSSTCAVFGDPGDRALTENLPKSPLHPYGATKLEAERRIERRAREEGLQAVILRYFNACGADPSARVGEWHEPETHLIPRVLELALADQPIEVFGSDYPTPDGTCIRDYVHVTDLAEAHLSAMERLCAIQDSTVGRFEAFNLGSENGQSVREVLSCVETALGKKLQVIERERRAGDVPKLVSDSALAKKELAFSPSRGLSEMIGTALAWEKRKPQLAAQGRKAVFLDRDGTINIDPGYLSDPEQLVLLPGSGEGLAALQRAGFLLIVITNQSGIARGLIERDALPRIHERLNWLLSEHGARIDHFEVCETLPETPSEDRKPAPGMILRAARRFGIRLQDSFLIGDRRTDLEAGRSAGLQGVILTRTGYGQEEEAALPPEAYDFAGENLSKIADWIVARGFKDGKED